MFSCLFVGQYFVFLWYIYDELQRFCFSKILLIIDLFNYYSSPVFFRVCACVKDNNNKQKDNIYLSFSEVLLFMAVKECNDRQLRFIGKIRFYFS
jgi:hypothetical protein